MIRLYDVNTRRVMTNAVPSLLFFFCYSFLFFFFIELFFPAHHHHGPINTVRYSSGPSSCPPPLLYFFLFSHSSFLLDGRMFASCSKDGSVRLWDGVSHKCFKYIQNAHEGAPGLYSSWFY